MAAEIIRRSFTLTDGAVKNGEGMSVFGGPDSFLKELRFEVRRNTQRWWVVDVALEPSDNFKAERVFLSGYPISSLNCWHSASVHGAYF